MVGGGSEGEEPPRASEELERALPNGDGRALSVRRDGEEGGAGEFGGGLGWEIGMGTHNGRVPGETEKLVREVP